ncbi:MAG TPA: S8 family serine peptidase, partial [Candidatus Angelobacter sp.]|nr:S8 family serine peptidase [Candidatus Angelobacter sp.]
MNRHYASGVAVAKIAKDKPFSARTLLLAATMFALIVAGTNALAQGNFPPPASVRPDRILVKPKPGADLENLNAAFGNKVHRFFSGIGGLEVVELPPGTAVAAVLAAYQRSGLVEYAEPDYLVQALSEPNDFNYANGDLWNLKNLGQYGGVPGADIDAPNGWSIQNTASNIIVAVIDTGVRYTHQDLAANMWINPGESGKDALGVNRGSNALDDDGDGYIDDVHGINAILGTGDPNDDYGHGTHVSGTIGGVGNNSVGVAGVAWRVQIMACKFLDATGQGSISDAIECIDYARKKGAKIINASWGGYTFTSTALYDAINSARGAGIVFVAACGNDNNNNDANPLYPASYYLDNIIAVAATDRTDTKAWFSNYGATTVELGAPGSPIFSCWNGSDSDYRYLDGTSMAAPHVVGACALLMAHYPGDTYQQIIRRVLSSTDPLPSLAGNTVTGGRLNLYKALVGAGIVADFSATPVSGLVPLTVSFTDASSGPVTSWLWDFGDGTASSAQQNPTHVYNRAGVFTATLTVTGNDGTTSSKAGTITVTGWMAVSPIGDFSSSGPQGGPFSPVSQTFTVRNQGSTSLSWGAGVDQDWVTLSATGGELAAGQQKSITVSINGQANVQPAGVHTATVAFHNLNNGDGDTARTVNLQVNPSPGILAVDPQSGFTSLGVRGGPFTPQSQTYTLTNSGGTPLDWTVAKNKNWISVSPASGTLTASGTARITVSINAAANTLK